MEKVARNCAHQSDLTEDKYVMCDEELEEDGDCNFYDDEDK